MLLSHFIRQAALRYERPVPELDAQQMGDLRSRPWPGNVRELRNVADRLVLGMPDQATPGPTPSTLEEQLLHFERYLITEALATCNGRAAVACERLGIPKKTVYDKMKRLDLSPQDFKVD